MSDIRIKFYPISAIRHPLSDSPGSNPSDVIIFFSMSDIGSGIDVDIGTLSMLE
jgi:hypothetical protein